MAPSTIIGVVTNRRLLRTAWLYTASKDNRNPVLGVKKFVKFLKDLVVMGLSELGLRIFKRSKIGPTWGLKNDQLINHIQDLVPISAPTRGGSNGGNDSNGQLAQINGSSAESSKDPPDRIRLDVLQ